MGYERTLPSREPSWSELSWSWRDRAMTEYIHLIDLLLIHIWRNMEYFDSNNGYFESFDVIYITYKYNIEDILKMLEHLIIGKKSDEFLFLHGYVFAYEMISVERVEFRNSKGSMGVALKTLRMKLYFYLRKILAAVKIHRLYVTKCKYRFHVIHLTYSFFFFSFFSRFGM